MVYVLTALAKLLVVDIVFLAILLALVVLLAMSRKVAYAVLKRNFYGYFSNPTGYVFLCLFVLLTSMAAFWPDEFFTSNLGTLGQLNKWFSYIMLFFIPAITMSIWAEERRQGTDELLLTLPADDFDIVAGKYVAAASIYSVSLLFSQLSTFIVLDLLTEGGIDTGLFFANYLGYWFIGLTMIALGMIASFLTNNLTVGFILGAMFNAPLAFMFKADSVLPQSIAQHLKSLSISERFDDFGRGVLSLSSIAYFLLTAAFGIYVCMVLIGKRHWSGGQGGETKLAHYLARIILIGCIAVGASFLFRNCNYRQDATENQVNSLSPATTTMIRNLSKDLGKDRDVVVDAFLSAEVPEQYAKIKYQVISMLKEFESTARAAGANIQVRIYDAIVPSSEEEKQAEQQYGIVPQMIRARERGAISDQNVLLGAAFRSGLQKVVIPFFEPGVPVEYELIRSLTTVAKPVRKKLGVLKTDAKLMGGLDQRTFQQSPSQPIVEELAKQFEISEVNAASPIDVEKIDVMLAVQPSSLGPEEMNNFIAAVKAGLPTAIFEDPIVVAMEGVPGTGDPKQSGNQMMMMMGQGQQPKGDIRPLWRLLGIEVPGRAGMMGAFAPDICWQEYNPYPFLQQTAEASCLWVFAADAAPGSEDALTKESEMTKGLKELLLLYSGVINKSKDSNLKFLPLVKTGQVAGTISQMEINSVQQSGLSRATEYQLRRGDPLGEQILGALIEGSEDASKTSEENRPLKAVYVADIDCMSGAFVNLRNREAGLEGINFQFQNITFVLNVIDVLAGETRYPVVRRHIPTYSTLKKVEAQADVARKIALDKQSEYAETFQKTLSDLEEVNAKSERELKEQIEKLQTEGTSDPQQIEKVRQMDQVAKIKRLQLTKKAQVEKERLQRERDKGIREARRQSEDSIRKIQDTYKMRAAFLPPIPPLLVGIAVFVSRRLREREGMSKNRLK